MSNISSPVEFTLNVAPILISWRSEWEIIELRSKTWDNSFAQKVQDYCNKIPQDEFLLNNVDNYLSFLPLKDQKISRDEIKELIEELEKYLGTTLSFEEISAINLDNIQDQKLQQTITSAFIRYLSYELQERLDFKKISSEGNIGLFFHFRYSRSIPLSKNPDIDILTLYEFNLHTFWHSTFTQCLSIDLKSELRGVQTLWETIRDLPKSTSTDVSSYDKDKIIWSIDQIKELQQWKEIFDLKFELIDVQPYRSGKKKSINIPELSRYSDRSIERFLSVIDYQPPRGEFVAELKLLNENDPNNRYFFPTSLLVQPVTETYIKNKPFEEKYHSLANPTVKVRKSKIEQIFSFLKNKGLTGEIMEFQGKNPEISYPSVRERYLGDYHKIPKIIRTGMEQWGKLQYVIIYKSDQNSSLAESVRQDIEIQINHFAKKNGQRIQVRTKQINFDKIKQEAKLQDIDPIQTLHVFLLDDKSLTKNVEKWFSAQNSKPVHFYSSTSLNQEIRIDSFQSSVPVLNAKTGGLPYTLSPIILENCVIIGVVNEQISQTTNIAGAVAVLPSGEFIVGSSHYSQDGSLKIDNLISELMDQISQIKNLEYCIVLKKGKFASQEIEKWENHLTQYDLDLVFLSKKDMSFYIFPKTIRDGIDFQLPVILYNPELLPNQFLSVIEDPIEETPQPRGFTLMKNTMGFTEQEIIDKVIPQILSMSMLSWEKPHPTSEPLPLYYARELVKFTKKTGETWNSSIGVPLFL